MSQPPPRILLVNDDGADAPGLWALYDVLAGLAETAIVAPMKEQSARSHAVTIRKRMALEEIERHGRRIGYRLDGTPADCVKLALAHLFRDRIELVVSGINWGSNVGHNIVYSGTVAAAIEAAMYGVPALAVSLRDERERPAHLETAARVTECLARDILANGLPRGTVLNVNVPDVALEKIAGMTVTRQGQESFVDHFAVETDAEGKTWCANIGDERVPSTGSEHTLDDLALNKNHVSVTPLRFDLTAEALLGPLGERLARLKIGPEPGVS